MPKITKNFASLDLKILFVSFLSTAFQLILPFKKLGNEFFLRHHQETQKIWFFSNDARDKMGNSDSCAFWSDEICLFIDILRQWPDNIETYVFRLKTKSRPLHCGQSHAIKSFQSQIASEAQRLDKSSRLASIKSFGGETPTTVTFCP